MSRSVVSKWIVIVSGLIFLARPVSASTADSEVESRNASSLMVYGAYLPYRLEWNDAQWGFGIAARAPLSPFWRVDVSLARFTSSYRALMPMTVGFAYGPEVDHGPRPWVEAGAGLYRLEPTRSPIATITPAELDAWGPGLGRGGYRSRQNNIGGYFGVGCDVPLSDHVGLGTGIRVHGWSRPDALIALQSGLSFGF